MNVGGLRIMDKDIKMVKSMVKKALLDHKKFKDCKHEWEFVKHTLFGEYTYKEYKCIYCPMHKLEDNG